MLLVELLFGVRMGLLDRVQVRDGQLSAGSDRPVGHNFTYAFPRWPRPLAQTAPLESSAIMRAFHPRAPESFAVGPTRVVEHALFAAKPKGLHQYECGTLPVLH